MKKEKLQASGKKTGKKRKKSGFFGNAVFFLCGTVAAALAFCALVPFIPPHKAYFPSLIGFAFPALLAANFILAAVYLLILRQARGLVFVACMLVNYANIRAFVRFGGQAEMQSSQWREPGRVKLLSYNVHLFDYYSSPASRRGVLKDQLLDFLEDQDADIVCMQEYFESKDGAFSSTPQMRRAGYRYSTQPQSGKGFFYGNRIYSRHPIVRQGTIEGLSRQDIVFADIVIGIDTLRVYDMHLASYRFDQADARFVSSLSSPGFSKSATYRQGSMRMLRKMKRATCKREEQIRHILRHARQEGAPARKIVCGDMNDHPVSYACFSFRRAGFQDAFVEAGSGMGQSYQGKYPSYRIDYIFAKGPLQVLSFSTSKVDYSDHRPVAAVFDLHAGEQTP